MAKVELDVIANTQKALRDISKFSVDAGKGFNALKVVAGAAVAAFAGKQVIDGIVNVTNAAAKQEVAVNKLNSALKLAGSFSSEASQDMQRFASDLQSITTIGDETTLEMLALAKSFGVTNEGAKSLVASAADLAEVTGMSLDSAVRNLGKTYGGLTGELGEVIPALKDLTVEQLKSGEAIDFVRQRFGGAAAAATDTYSGALEQLKNAFGDLQEEIGEIITNNPVVIQIFKSLKGSFEDLDKFISENQNDLREFVNKGLRFIVAQSPNVVKVFTYLSKLALNLSKSAAVATGQFAKWFSTALKGADSLGDALTLLSQPINATVLAMNEIASAKASVELAYLHDRAKMLGVVLNGNGGIVDGIREFIAGVSKDDARKELDEVNARIAQLNGQLQLAKEVGKNIVIDMEIDRKSFSTQLQELADSIPETLDFLKGAEINLDEGAKKLIAALEGLKDQLEVTPDSKATGGSGGSLSNKEAEQISILREIKDFFVGDFGKTIATAFGQNLTKGRQGGQAVVGAVGGAAADALVPGAGSIVGPILTDLAGATKEEAEQMAKDFAAGITEGVKALAENAPIFVEALAENAGPIITALVAAGPKLTVALIQSIPSIVQALATQLVEGIRYQIQQLAPEFDYLGEKVTAASNYLSDRFNAVFGEGGPFDKIAREFDDLGTNISDQLKDLVPDKFAETFQNKVIVGMQNGAQAFTDKLVEKAKEVVDALNPTKTQGGIVGTIFGSGGSSIGEQIGTAVRDPSKIFGGATGGLVGGTGNQDTELFRLMPGELIIDKQRTARLDKAIEKLDGNDGMGEVVALLSRILEVLSGSTTVQSELRLNERVLADIILQLNKSNARLTA